MITTTSTLAVPIASARTATVGDRVRVAHGVFGRLGRVRSISTGHIVVQYDRGGRDIIDPTRRAVWIIS